MNRPAKRHSPRLVSLLGVNVHAMDLTELLTWIRQAVESKTLRVLANHNLHSVALHHTHAKMRAFFRMADVTVADGRPLIAWSCFLGLKLKSRHKLSWLDHLDDILAMALANDWTVAHLGCQPGVGERAAHVLGQRHPGLRILHHHGFFSFPGPDNDAVIDWLNHMRPQLLLVGMGMPRQEHWLIDQRPRLPPCVAITCGATFDYIADALPTPPRWLSRFGLEWCFRLACEPRRLAHRYLIEPLTLLPWLLRDLRLTVRTSAHAGAQLGADHDAAIQRRASNPPA